MNDTCGCCEGVESITPVRIANRPGLGALAYRVGTHARFLETMLAQLTRRLPGLGTRGRDDPSIALLDAWATVADVLTFYQERIANEGYLRTATERRSVLELGRLVGYRLRPGVAATAYLAFTLEEDARVRIGPGNEVQSVPGPGELPQSFETVEELEARGEWNTLAVRQTRAQDVTALAALAADADASQQLYLGGITTGLALNDPLLADFGEGQELFRVLEVVPDATADRTRVTLRPWQATSAPAALPAPLPVPSPPPLALAGDEGSGAEADVEKVAARHTDLARFGVPSASVIAGRVVRLLELLRTVVLLGMAGTDLSDFLRDAVLPVLRRERGRALRSAPLTAWLDSMVGELEELETRVAAPGLVVPSGAASVPAVALTSPLTTTTTTTSASATTSAPTTTTIGDVLDSLAEPASVPPANPLRLPRRPGEVFGAASDVLPSLLTAFRPELAGLLYEAWRNVPATPPSNLRIHALRTRASAFGHSAPDEPVKNAQGVVVGSREWTLFKQAGDLVPEPFEVLLVLPLSERGTFPSGGGTVRIVVQLGNARRELTVPLDDLLEGPFTVGVPAAGEQVVFTLSLPGESPGTPARLEVVFARRAMRFETVLDTALGRGEELTGRTRLTWSSDGSDPTTVRYTLGRTADPAGSFPEGEGPSPQTVLRVTIGGQQRVPTALVPTEQPDVISLDATYPTVVPDSFVVIERPGQDGGTPADDLLIRRVRGVREASRDDYGINAKSTFLQLDAPWLSVDADQGDSFAVIRGSAVYAQSEQLEVVEAPLDPVEAPICSNEIPLERLYDGLQPGRWLIVAGERTDLQGDGLRVAGVPAAELVMLGGVRQEYDPDEEGARTRTTLVLAAPLAYCYKRDTVTIHGNVAKATHGKTQPEVLGSGDSTRPNQSFELKQKPLTYVPAPTPTGVARTLEVHVDGVRWTQADDLLDLGATDRRFITKTGDDDTTMVVFGNGREGARLPTGQENLAAVYRFGIGRAGNVLAGQLSLLGSRPQGVLSVANPLPAAGGADREGRDQARANIPLAVTSLDRIVSVQDYADFARTFAGIAKASATLLGDGRRQVVHLTIAGEDDIPITPASDLYRHLREALGRFGDPFQPLQIDVRRLRLMVVVAKVRLQPDFLWEAVAPAVRAALEQRFAFARRDLGQDVTRSEVLSAAQAVRGVDYVDLDLLDTVDEDQVREQLVDPTAGGLAAGLTLRPRLRANLAHNAAAPPFAIVPAELIHLDPREPGTLILEILE
jgi:predicted phage baseplate assembly protein